MRTFSADQVYLITSYNYRIKGCKRIKLDVKTQIQNRRTIIFKREGGGIEQINNENRHND